MHAATAMLNSVFAEIIDHLSGLESYLGVQDTEWTAAVLLESTAADCVKRRGDDNDAAVSLTGNLRASRATEGADGCWLPGFSG